MCGDVNGNFKVLFSRVENVLKKTPGFDVSPSQVKIVNVVVRKILMIILLL